MISVIPSVFAVLGFGLALWLLRIGEISKAAIGTVMTGLSAMMDSGLDDDAKEKAVRKAGISLIVAGFSTFVRFVLAFAAAALPIALADLAGLAQWEQVLALMLQWDFIVIVSVGAIVIGYLLRRLLGAKPSTSASQNPYSASDRFFHILAFSSPVVLKAASWIEDRFIATPASASAQSPIFITSLARGGTTALLNALNDMPQIATHTYRDMPFLTAPTLWRRLTGGQSRAVARRQRAHGDGLEIDLNSPEAFEEVIWMMFWPEKYRADKIGLWQDRDEKPKAQAFLKHHMQKIVHSRTSKDAAARYCSKNNGNIARLPFLKTAFPDARIVIPLRRPESHAASLLRQHKNFLVQQSDDEFVRRYMRDIGHFEFGDIHKPIGFADFSPNQYDPATPDYWLAYWIAAFENVLSCADTCILVTQDDLRHAPEETMTALCDALELSPGQMAFSDYFRSTPDISPVDVYDPDLYEKARKIYDALCQKALHVPQAEAVDVVTSAAVGHP